MKVICLKLASGEELIAQVHESSMLAGNDETQYADGAVWDLPKSDLILSHVKIITIQPAGQGQVGIGFVPWAVGNPDGKIKIRAEEVACVYQPRIELEKGFLSQTSGIQIAGSGSLMPGM